MEKFLIELKTQSEKNPLLAIGVGVAVVTATTKFIEVIGNLYGRRTWSQEVARRAKKALR